MGLCFFQGSISFSLHVPDDIFECCVPITLFIQALRLSLCDSVGHSEFFRNAMLCDSGRDCIVFKTMTLNEII